MQALDKYLAAVEPSRTHASTRVSALADRFHGDAEFTRFLLRFFALRLGPLADTAAWLELSAEACERRYPLVADDLREAARVERFDRDLLLEDLGEFERVFGAAEVARSSELPRDPKIARHCVIRAMVPARDEPLVVLAVDLELAVLGLELGPELIRRAHKHLPGGMEHRFLQARNKHAKQRSRQRSERLDWVLEKQPTRAASWARVATDVTQSYLDAIEALADRRSSNRPRTTGHVTGSYTVQPAGDHVACDTRF